MPIDTIILPNTHEFNRRGMDPRFAGTGLSIWRDVGSAFADLAIFWGCDDKLIISPRPIPQEFVEYIRDRFAICNLFIRSPCSYSSMFCRDILADDALMDEVVSTCQGVGRVQLYTWGATEDTYLLVDTLTERGVCIETPDIPRRSDFWSSLYLDSKIGFRLLCAELGRTDARFSMASGLICDSLHDALEATQHFHCRGMSCVLKANLGVSGLGTLILDPEWSKRPRKALETFVSRQIRDLPYFRCGPVIVEQYVRRANPQSGSRLQYGSIFSNAYISPDKHIEILGAGCELRNSDNFYVGALLGNGVIPDPIDELIEPIMQQLCEAVLSYGYRGHFGVDFLLDESNVPLMLELNCRRCGESHVYDLATRLFGSQWRLFKMALTRLPMYIEIVGVWHLSHVLEAFDKVNQLRAGDGVLIVPTCVSWLYLTRPGLGYVVFGPHSEAIAAAEIVLLELLEQKGIKGQNSELASFKSLF